jgi:F420 biosynthesis protein FbiB-like protein
VRYFTSRAVERALVAEMLRDAVWAPSPHNSQPWRFTVLFDPADKGRLARAMAARLEDELKASDTPGHLINRQTQRSRERISGAPVVLICSLVADGLAVYEDERRAALEWQMAVQSVGAVLQTLFLVAHSRGVATCWMAAPMYCPDVVRSALSLPQEFEPQALVLMGYEAAAGKVRERRDFEAVVDLR